MTKSKDTIFDPSLELKLLIRRLLTMTEDFIYNKKKFHKDAKKIWGEEKNIKGKLAKDYYELNDKLENTVNSYLIYAFSLYEIYSSNLLKFLASNNKNISRIYEDKWDKLFMEMRKGNHQNIEMSPKIFKSKKLKIDNYQILLSSLNTNLNSFLRDIQGINKISINDSTVSSYLSEYSIYREVRNLLTHRGSNIDKKFLDSITKTSNLDIKRNKEPLNEFLKDQFNRLEYMNGKKTKNINFLLGQQIDLDFMSIISSIIFNAMWHSFEEVHDPNEKLDSVVGEIFHDILWFSYKNDSYRYLSLVDQIFNTYKKNTCKNQINDVGDIAKFNYLLSNDLLKSALLRFRRGKEYKGVSETDAIKKVYQMKLKRDLEENFQFSVLDNDIQNLLKSCITNKTKDFLNIVKEMQINQHDIDEWFIFAKYKKNKDFSKIYSSKHNSKRYFEN